jgi:hypothetical protein
MRHLESARMPEDALHPPSHGPELLIGIAGAVGTDLEIVSRALEITLGEVGYKAREIRLSALLDLIDWTSVPCGVPKSRSLL